MHRGDFAIVDTTDREPVHGEMFLVEWMNGDRQPGELRQRAGRFGKSGIYEDSFRWFIEWRSPVRNVDGNVAMVTRWADGPYDTPSVVPKIVGKIVGIYEPDFRVQLGEAA